METSEEERPVAAKRRRTENLDPQILENVKPLDPQNDEQIIQEKQQIIEELKDLETSKLKLQTQIAEKDTRRQQLEDRLKKLTGPLLETKLSDEVLLKIFGYLSTYDVLRNIARVSTKFKRLSEDPFLIRKIEMHERQWTKDQIRGCLNVLKNSQNLRFFSFDLNWNFDTPAYKIFLKGLPTLNHQHLEEFCINGHGGQGEGQPETQAKTEASLIRKLMRYLKKCPNLKILKIESEEKILDELFFLDIVYCPLEWLVEENIFRCLKFQNLEELHLNGFEFEDITPQHLRKIINMFHKNLPKLRRLCFKLDNFGRLDENPEYGQILQKFASEKNVTIEITGTPVYRSILEVEHPSSGFKIFNSMPK